MGKEKDFFFSKYSTLHPDVQGSRDGVRANMKKITLFLQVCKRRSLCYVQRERGFIAL